MELSVIFLAFVLVSLLSPSCGQQHVWEQRFESMMPIETSPEIDKLKVDQLIFPSFAPEQIHVVPSGRSNSYSIDWVTAVPLPSSADLSDDSAAALAQMHRSGLVQPAISVERLPVVGSKLVNWFAISGNSRDKVDNATESKVSAAFISVVRIFAEGKKHEVKEYYASPLLFVDNWCFTRRLMHSVQINVEPGRNYFYSVSMLSLIDFQQIPISGSSTSIISPKYSFPSSSQFSFYALDWLSPPSPPTISLIADFGSSNIIHESSLNALLSSSNTSSHALVLHVGDVAYDLAELCNIVGDDFMRKVQPVAAHTPYVFGVGNHELERAFDHPYWSYQNRYASVSRLSASAGSESSRFWSFNVGLIHFVHLDADLYIYPQFFSLLRRQFEWLTADLAAVNRSATPWIVALSHRALVCNGRIWAADCLDEASVLRYGVLGWMSLEQLFAKHAVDLVFTGHTHFTMRTFPMLRGRLQQASYDNPRGPVYIVAGRGGTRDNDPFQEPMQDVDAFRYDNHSFVQVRADNRTHLLIRHVASTGTTIDELFLVQSQWRPTSWEHESEQSSRAMLQLADFAGQLWRPSGIVWLSAIFRSALLAVVLLVVGFVILHRIRRKRLAELEPHKEPATVAAGSTESAADMSAKVPLCGSEVDEYCDEHTVESNNSPWTSVLQQRAGLFVRLLHMLRALSDSFLASMLPPETKLKVDSSSARSDRVDAPSPSSTPLMRRIVMSNGNGRDSAAGESDCVPEFELQLDIVARVSRKK